jgi:hypothetical protein
VVAESAAAVTVETVESSPSSRRRLLQATASSQLQVTISGASTSAVQTSFQRFKSAYASSDATTNPLQAKSVDNSAALGEQYRVACADGSTKATASDCTPAATNGPSSAATVTAVGGGLGVAGGLMLAAGVTLVAAL